MIRLLISWAPAAVWAVASTDATTIAVNLGAKLFLSETLSFGVNLKDVDTR